jgi:geranylgeranyl pyrophosphate synthase
MNTHAMDVTETKVLALSDSLRHQTYGFMRTYIFPVLNWPEFEGVVESWIANREQATVQSNYSDVLPSLAYVALGGDLESSIPLSAAWMFFMFAARVLDDIQDQDCLHRPWLKNGLAQSIPISTALLNVTNICLAHLDTDIVTLRELLSAFGRTSARAAKAQSRPTITYDSPESLEHYFEHIVATTAELFAAGTWAGGRLKTDDLQTLQALREFGYGLGMKTAVILDCRDLNPKSAHKQSDLAMGSYKLPVLFAVSTQTEHPEYERLISLLQEEKPGEDSLNDLTAILTDMEALTWSVRVALEFEDVSRAALQTLPKQASTLLMNYVG